VFELKVNELEVGNVGLRFADEAGAEVKARLWFDVSIDLRFTSTH
jgi:hypothetical protein